uniref:Uncharacterized protein n=1 Tax=Arundo donax TaxID=35708 RepID=A0A0A9CCR2_ARUDO
MSSLHIESSDFNLARIVHIKFSNQRFLQRPKRQRLLPTKKS